MPEGSRKIEKSNAFTVDELKKTLNRRCRVVGAQDKGRAAKSGRKDLLKSKIEADGSELQNAIMAAEGKGVTDGEVVA